MKTASDIPAFAIAREILGRAALWPPLPSVPSHSRARASATIKRLASLLFVLALFAPVVAHADQTNRFYYDRTDRLVGAEYGSGLSIGYVYDGNGNPLRQVYLANDPDANNLPALWRFLNGLSPTNSSGTNAMFADADGDGWSNYQEWQAGSSPTNAASVPDVFGLPGTNIASMAWPFTPSNFVVSVGQLDGTGAEEVVIGADGNPSTTTNFVLILSESSFGWTTQRVDIGAFGITSIAVGQPVNRSAAAIYLGLRQAGGSGRIMELLSTGGAWQTNVIATSTNEVAYVLGVRPGQNLLATFSPTNGPPAALYSLIPTNVASAGWLSSVLDTNKTRADTMGSLSPWLLTSSGSSNVTMLDAVPVRLLADGDEIQCGWTVAGLLAYYPFNGNALDESGNGRHGVREGGDFVSDRAGRLNSALSLGENPGEYLKVSPFSVPSLGELTVFCQIMPDSGLVEPWLLDYYVDTNNRISVLLKLAGQSNSIRFLIQNAPTVDTNAVGYVTNTWQSIAITWQSSNGLYRIFTNGIPVVSGVRALGRDVSGNGQLFIGIPNTNSTPHTDTNQVYRGIVDEVAIYGRVLSDAEIAALAQGANPVAIGAVIIPEPTVAARLRWRGKSVEAGQWRSSFTNANTVMYACIDDKNANNVVDAGDDFVAREFLVVGTNVTTPTPVTNTLSTSPLASSYGLASVKYLNANDEVFFTGEPDGRVFSWIATNSSGPLQRQLFSAHHAGKAWHALAGVRTLEPGEGLVGLRVDPSHPTNCDVIFWPPQPQLPQFPSIQQTKPVVSLLPTNTLSSVAFIPMNLVDAEGNASSLELEYESAGTNHWNNAVIVQVDGANYLPGTRVAASPTGAPHTFRWNAGLVFPAGTQTNLLLRSRATDVTLTGEWFTNQYQLDVAIDTNSLPDWWELQYFGTTGIDPNDDPDNDGFKNWQEYIADTNPTNAASHLRISVSLLSNGVKLDWLAGSNSWKYLQRTVSLSETNTTWPNIWTSPPPPSADSGSYTDSFGADTLRFYRLKATQ